MLLNTQIYISYLDRHNIQNIIFDLGGVIVNIDPHLTAQAFADLSNSDPVDIMQLHQSHNFFTEYEKGLITDEKFREHICEFIGKIAPAEVIDRAWGALLLDIPTQKVKLIKEAKEKYRTFLLSNTNHIHWLKFSKTVKDTTGMDIGYFFEKVYYSYEMGKRKPDEDIFEQVLQENSLIPDETLLIDDSLPNIETAQRLGIKTLHVSRNQEIIELNGRK